ncbi:hypothetical protein BGZ92_004499 [Podila epicladia]|nr:hypothetical protein BGZ92_004499 [Podila epicladia]
MVTSAKTKLQFKQKLTGGSAAEMLKKLKELHSELKDMEQDTVDTNSFSAVKKELVDTSIVNHKDKGVRIYAACCIADLLRLYAPDAPYSKTSLKTIFRLFVDELRHIATPENTYYNQYSYLLESLSAVKSIVLITDLSNADEITTDLFRNMFDDVRPQQAKNVHISISELLEHVIMETSSLPQEIVDIILAQFLHKHKLDNPAAYRLACDLGNHCAEKLQRYVFQYFSDIISAAGSEEVSAKELNDFKTVHQLVVELNKGAPILLLNVIPQLEGELKLTDVNIRSLAVSSLGQMFAEKTSQLASHYESTWKAWLLRRNDKVSSVRIHWLECLVNLIKSQPTLAKDLNEGLAERFLDPEEKVRSIACKIIGELDYETSLHHVQKDTLVQVGHRCRDKKAYPEIENGTQASLSHFAWMPSAILHALYVNDPEIQTYVEHAVYTTILPPHGTVASRAQRLIVTFATLDDKGRTGLLSVLRRGVDARQAMNTIMKLLKMQADAVGKPEAEAIDKKLADFIKVFSEKFPDPIKASQLLHKYAKVHDEKFRQSITDCMDSSLPVREIRKAGKETLTRLENIAPAALELFSIIVQRISLTVINKEVVSELIRSLGGAAEHRQEAGELLRSISLIYPSIFEDHLGDMISLLRDHDATGASDTLHTLAGFAKQFARSLPANSQSKEVIQTFLEAGTILQATHATIVLASIKDNDDMCQEIAQSMYDAAVDWVEASELNEYTLSKIMGLKVLVNRAIVLASDHVSAQDAARPLFKLLWTLITQDGELVKEQNSSNVLKSYLRLSAARFVVKLCCSRPVYERMVTVLDFCHLALIIQDPVFRVRHGLAKRIMKYIRKKELHVRHLAVLFLAAHEPEVEWRKIIRDFLVQSSRTQDSGNKLMHNELPQDDATGPHESHSIDDLNLSAKYIEFYLDTMANSENISLIFYIASLLKTVRFSNLHESNENLYALSDLAQYLIQEKSRSHNWTLTSHPGQVALPRELYSTLASSEGSVEISKKSYLSAEWVYAREHRGKAERKPRPPPQERKIGQAAKRRSRSASLSNDEGDSSEPSTSVPVRAKRIKKAKVEKTPETPTRRMASRAAKAKAAAYKDLASSEEEEVEDELRESDEDD